jgi:parallel beta-helix repeat protein
MNGDASLGGDGVISSALVSGNVIHDNGLGGGSGINMDGVRDSRIENNLIYNNHASGITLYRIDGGQPSSGNAVVNNTVYQAADARWALNIQQGSANNSVRNNILISQHPTRGAIDISSNSLAGFTSDYNVVISRLTTNGGNSTQTLAQWRASTGQDTHSLVGSAAQLFVNPTSDFHLKSGAAAIDAGTGALAPALDLEGDARPVGAGFDIGADEFGSAAQGDNNGDGAVNVLDFILWRTSDGTSGGFTEWRENFDATSGAAAFSEAAVPEPPAALLALTVAVWAAAVRIRNFPG